MKFWPGSSGSRTEFDFPDGKVGLGSGYRIDMDLPGSAEQAYLRPSQLAGWASGPDSQYSGKGPSQVFLLVELVWGTVKDPNSVDDCKRAWIIVQFQRNRRLATVWDLCPDLNVRGYITGWASSVSWRLCGVHGSPSYCDWRWYTCV